MPSEFIDRLSASDTAYQAGDLSIFPQAKDTRDTLFHVRNNAETNLAQTFTYTARYLVVDSTALFPPKGIIRVGTELIYYDLKTNNTFERLKRGFGGSRQNIWPVGTSVVNAVIADPHNAVKDAIINIERDMGLVTNPDPASLNGLLRAAETKFYSPKPIFRAIPRRGVPPLQVKFQNFSVGDPIRFLWDFGDGGTSTDTSPVHTYVSEGIYTVKLNMISSLGAQGITTKTDYIFVSNDEKPSFFYVDPMVGTTSTTFEFVDQSDGIIISRNWIFDDGNRQTELDPDVHFTSHIYTTPGQYNPILIIVFQDQSLKRLVLTDPIIVT